MLPLLSRAWLQCLATPCSHLSSTRSRLWKNAEASHHPQIDTHPKTIKVSAYKAFLILCVVYLILAKVVLIVKELYCSWCGRLFCFAQTFLRLCQTSFFIECKHSRGWNIHFTWQNPNSKARLLKTFSCRSSRNSAYERNQVVFYELFFLLHKAL